jgi:hypothetical protein
MATRTLVSCDNCGAEPAATLTLNVGLGARSIDLCGGCRDAYGLAKLQALLDDFGQSIGNAPGVRDMNPRSTGRPLRVGPVECPRCGGGYGSRGALITHLAATHHMGRVDASKLAPTKGSMKVCPHCGMHCEDVGFAQHVHIMHKSNTPGLFGAHTL